VASVLAACASILGIQNGTLDDASAEGGGSDAAVDYVAHDAVALDVNTALCDGGIATVSPAIWVSKKIGTDTTGCGSTASPCASIGYALGAGVMTLYLDDSTFTENITLDSTDQNYTIQGGFLVDAGVWTPACNSGLTNVVGREDGGSAAIEVHGASGLTLRLLTVSSKANGAAGSGESVYAVRVTDTPNVVLDNVTLIAQAGGAGATGPYVTPTTAVGCAAGVSGSGTAGGVGAPGAAGQITVTGYVPAYGQGGDSGDYATVATPPGNGVCQTCYTTCTP
jgi:hypothetical protein